MWLAGIRITTLACAGILAAASAMSGCAASESEVRSARNAGYDTDFARVYSQALAAVRELYPNVQESSSDGTIKTAWHPVRLVGDQHAASNNQVNISPLTSQPYTSYFVRFDVNVVGGKPWRVRVHGQAGQWRAGDALPVELRGGDEPHWLRGRVDALQVAIHQRLERHAVKVAAPPPATTAQGAEPAAEELDRFGKIPPAAAQAVARVLAAAKKRDFGALATGMHEDFTWNLGAAPSAHDALAIWRADSSVLEALETALEAGCRAEDDKQTVTCPAAASEQPGYTGYRASFSPAANGVWKMASFVSGE